MGMQLWINLFCSPQKCSEKIFCRTQNSQPIVFSLEQNSNRYFVIHVTNQKKLFNGSTVLRDVPERLQQQGVSCL